jgi:hypothetical protein
MFATLESPHLLPPPSSPYDLPVYAEPKVHRDHHVEVARALYSVPGNLIGQRVEARADRLVLKVFHRGQLVKVHPRMPPGGRSTDPADLPPEKAPYAMRDIDHLCRVADEHGPWIGAYAAALVGGPLPWTKMRQVYALFGLVKKWGAQRVDAACARALEAETVHVPLVARMLELGTETQNGMPPPPPPVPTRFAREPHHFAVRSTADVAVEVAP